MANDNLTVTSVLADRLAGTFSSVELVESLLDRIDRFDDDIQAWVTLDRKRALADAEKLDQMASRGKFLPLHGVPVGIKDIIDVAGVPTIAGFEPFKDRVPSRDAKLVSRYRELGAIILGKTHTTQFASGGPAPTSNPWDLNRSPAGSSAGSGAAVAAGMAPATVGTQTAGSVLRPAAFCGVAAMKPSFGWFSLDGVLPLAWSLDHLGIYGMTPADLEIQFNTLTGKSEGVGETSISRPRIALLTEFLEMSEPVVAAHLQSVADSLRNAGAEIVETTLPVPTDLLFAAHQLIFTTERAASEAMAFNYHSDKFDQRLRDWNDVGALIPATSDIHARRLRRRMAQQVDQMAAQYDALLLPTASEPATEKSSTGDRRFQVPGTFFGLPSISLPTGLSDHPLPIGTQLMTRRGQDHHCLAMAKWCASVTGLIDRPVLE